MHIRNSFKTGNSIIIAFLVFFVSASITQAQTPTPTPNDDTIRVNTDLIQTNVTVVDKNNRFVEGLKSEQFELKVDGKIVPIDFFQLINGTGINRDLPNQSDTQSSNALNAGSNLQSERKVIFFIDDLHLSVDSLNRTRSAVTHFIEEEKLPRDSVLILSTSGQIGFLQQFTDNNAVLKAALARIKTLSNNTLDTDQPPMTEYAALRIVNGDRNAAEYYIDKIIEGFSVGSVGIPRPLAYVMVRNRATSIAAGISSATNTTLASLENLLKTTGQLSGRKLIFFASDGFYIDAKKTNLSSDINLQRIINLATRSGSVINTIDTRGLFSETSADATGSRPIDPEGRLDKSMLGEGTLSQEGLFVLAEQTGGRFLKNQNYFDKWIDRTLDESANYYVLAWSPEMESSSDINFKQIEVSIIGRPDLSVRFSQGYLPNSGKNSVKNTAKSTNEKDVNKKISEPFNENRIEEPQTDKLLPTKLSLNYLDVPNVGGVLTSSVQIATDELNYNLSGKQSAIDLAGIILNAKGKQVADFKTGLKISPSVQNKSEANEQSIIYNNRTPLPPGIYQVKVAIRETQSGQVGGAAQWIEIPDLSKKQLTLGSLLLGAEEVKKMDNGEEAGAQIQFSVDHRFSRPLKLNFLSFVYNTSQGKTRDDKVNLAIQIEVLNARNQVVVNSSMRALEINEVSDFARIPFSGSVRRDVILPGIYTLRITVNDLKTKNTAVQQTVFTVK